MSGLQIPLYLVLHIFLFQFFIFYGSSHEIFSNDLTTAAAAAASINSRRRSKEVIIPWKGQSVRDLHREYSNIFKYGNRNAASHRWSTFLLDRARNSFTLNTLKYMFSGFCAVSGSPISPSDYNRYGLELPSLMPSHSKMFGFMHYCCWPCVCDTQDFIKVDTLNVTTMDDITHTLHFAVIGNPCNSPEALNMPFVQPFDGRSTTLAWEAREVRCNKDGTLEGATLSDHGHIIISMFFDAVPVSLDNAGGVSNRYSHQQQQPGRIVETTNGIKYQSEKEYQSMCTDRARNGYNSGMGEIFRKVASISMINTATPTATAVAAAATTTSTTTKSEL